MNSVIRYVRNDVRRWVMMPFSYKASLVTLVDCECDNALRAITYLETEMLDLVEKDESFELPVTDDVLRKIR